ncbi:upstream activation factor subunit spp27 homolog Non2 isoform X2 [Rhodnius prolixus]|uniref:upstream activation factor subunit spp27 homolog Non2 isoform X2 n=1 Tax=Rhodnius prolixus TaxID=13249 RepID=UPI003D18A176
MAEMTKDELRKEITAILKGADLGSTSSKKVRQELETKLEVDLSSRKKEIDELVMQCIKENEKKGKKPKKNGNKNDDDDEDEKDEDDDDKEDDDEDEEEEEEVELKKSKRGAPKKAAKRKASSDESEDASDDKGSDEEYSPTKKAKGAKGKKAGAKGRKKKGGSDSDSDEDWGKGKKGNAPKKAGGKRGTTGYNKTCTLTPELAAVVGQDSMARHEVVKKVWSIIKEKNLYDPKNKQYAICDDNLMKVIGVKRFRTFGMMKYLKKHFVD